MSKAPAEQYFRIVDKRICDNCGMDFMGGPYASVCPGCRKKSYGKAAKERAARKREAHHGLTETERNIILALANNNMDTSKAGREAMYHRNSIVYHQEKITEKYGLDPRKFYDLVRLVEMAKEGEQG